MTLIDAGWKLSLHCRRLFSPPSHCYLSSPCAFLTQFKLLFLIALMELRHQNSCIIASIIKTVLCRAMTYRDFISAFFIFLLRALQHYKSISMLLSRVVKYLCRVCLNRIIYAVICAKQQFCCSKPKKKMKRNTSERWSIDADCLNWFAFQCHCLGRLESV